LAADLALVGIQRDFQELLRHAGIEQVHVKTVSVPGRGGRPFHDRSEITAGRQGLAGLESAVTSS